MTTRYKDDVPKLFEFWCEVEEPVTLGQSGRMLSSFPENFDDPLVMGLISDFAFPCELPRDKESILTFSFVLTTIDSKFRFGFCRHDQRTRTAMVVLTYLPWHDVFTKFLNVLSDLHRNETTAEFQQFLSAAYVAVPEPGACLKLHYRNRIDGGTTSQVHLFQRPAQFLLPSMPEDNNLNMYYNFVEPKNMIAVFAAMLAERRIVFTSAHMDRLSACVQSANAFLNPMVWEHIFIPILPMKMRDTLGATMPFLIGVPISVLEKMTKEEVGDIVILNCDENLLQSPYDDVKAMPAELVSHLKKQLNHSAEHMKGNRVSRIFLGVLVQLIGGYRDGIKFSQDEGFTFVGESFLASKSSHIQTYLRQLMQSQLFQQFIDGRLKMLETGKGFSDEFEMETIRHSEKLLEKSKQYKIFRSVKDKTNPAVKSAVQSVRQGSRGMKAAYKDLRSKLREKPVSTSNSSFGETSMTQSHHFDASGSSIHAIGNQMHSAPNSPLKIPNSTLVNSAAPPLLRPHRSGSFDHKSTGHDATTSSRLSGSAPLVTPDTLSLHSMRPRERISSNDSLSSLATNDNGDIGDDGDDDDDDEVIVDDDRFDIPPTDRSPPVPAPRTAPQRPPPPHPLALAASASASISSPSPTPSAAHSHPSPMGPPSSHHHHITPSKTIVASPRHHYATAKNMTLLKASTPNARVSQPSHSAHHASMATTIRTISTHPADVLSSSSSSSLQQLQRLRNGFENDFVGPSSLTSSSSVVEASSLAPSHTLDAKEPPKSPDLITLDISFDLEDFDPLNQNAKQLPPLSSSIGLPVAVTQPTAPVAATVRPPLPAKPTMLCMGSGMGNGYRPVYPTTTLQNNHNPNQQQPFANSQANDADVELLRKYGLDKFSLSSGTSGSSGSGAIQPASSLVRRNWTDFD